MFRGPTGYTSTCLPKQGIIPKLFNTLCAATLMFSFTIAYAQETTYGFQSQPFNDVFGTYTAGQNLTGSITLSEPLPANASMNVNTILVSYSFSDGVVTLDQTNSEILGGINLATDAGGRIQSYGMTFWESPLATASGEIFTGMDILFNPGVGSPGCTPSATCFPARVQINSGDLECFSTFGGECDGAFVPDSADWGRILRVAEAAGRGSDRAPSTSKTSQVYFHLGGKRHHVHTTSAANNV